MTGRHSMLCKMFDRMTFDSQTIGDRARIQGMRIPVLVIVDQIAHGATVEEILQGFPVPNILLRGQPNGGTSCGSGKTV